MPSLPSASTATGNRIALPMEATFGLKPCCSACFQNVVKSGGSTTPVTISQLADLERADLRREIVGEVLIAAGIGELVAALLEHRREADVLVAPGIAVAIVRKQPADGFVGRDLAPHVGEDGDDVLEPPEEMIGVVEGLPGRRTAAGIGLPADEPGLPRRHRWRCTAPPRSRIGSRPGSWSRASMATSIRSILSWTIRSLATSAARFGLDWLSLTIDLDRHAWRCRS